MALPPADFTGYAPGNVPGSYTFQRRNGAPVAFGGPLAEKLKAQLDAANPYGQGPASGSPGMTADPNPYQDMAGSGSMFAPGSQAVAGAPAGGRRNVTQADIDAAAAARAAQAPTAPPPIAGGRRNVTAADIAAQEQWRGSAPNRQPSKTLTPEEQAAWDKRQAPASAQAAAPAADSAAQASPAQGPAPKVFATKGGGRMYVDANGRTVVTNSGSPGQTKAQLEARVGQGVATPTKTETIREGGYEGDPNYLPEMARISDAERVVNAKSAYRQAAAAEDEAAAYGEQAARMATRVELENKTAERLKDEAMRAELEYDTARQEYRNSKVDPNRMFKGPTGAIKAIGAVIAQAVGAYAATISKTENFAGNVVQNAINRDIQAQRDEIAVRGNSADNALANLTRKLGDQKAAEAVLRSAQGEYAANLLKARAAQSKRPEIIEMAQRWDLAEQQRQVQLREDYLKAKQGKITEKVAGEIAYAKAGTAPTERPATLEEATAYENLAGKQLGNMKTDQEIQAGGPGAETSDTARKEAATIATGKGRIEAIAAKYGYKVDPATGEVTPARDGAGFPGRLGALVDPAERARFESEMVQVGRTIAGVLNPGAEPTPALTEANTPDPNARDGAIAGKLQAGYQQMLESERNMGLDPKARKKLEGNRQSSNVSRATAAPLPAPRVVNP